MSSLIDDAFRAAQAALTSCFGEDIDLIPMVAGEYATARDAERPVVHITATLMTNSEPVSIRGQQSGQGAELTGSTRITTDDPQLWIDADTAAALPWEPARGDIARALGRSGQNKFTVLAVYPGDKGDLVLILTRGSVALSAEEES